MKTRDKLRRDLHGVRSENGASSCRYHSCYMCLIVTMIATSVSVSGMSCSGPETLGRRLPACHFPVASALWHQHKSGLNDGPHFTQEDRGAVTHHGHSVSQPQLRQRPGPQLQTGACPLSPCRLSLSFGFSLYFPLRSVLGGRGPGAGAGSSTL